MFADFDANFTALNGGTVGGASSYVANGGETLQSIAAQRWGDANLWYKLAEANPGLSAGGALGGGSGRWWQDPLSGSAARSVRQSGR